MEVYRRMSMFKFEYDYMMKDGEINRPKYYISKFEFQIQGLQKRLSNVCVRGQEAGFEGWSVGKGKKIN